MIRKVMGGGGGAKSKKNFPRKSLIKTIYSYGFGQKQYAQGGSVQVRLLQINYEVNDKSRLEIKRDFFKSQHDSWVNIIKTYLDWYSCRPDTEIEEFNILHVLFTNLYWPNNLELSGINVILCINTHSQTSLHGVKICAFHNNN